MSIKKYFQDIHTRISQDHHNLIPLQVSHNNRSNSKALSYTNTQTHLNQYIQAKQPPQTHDHSQNIGDFISDIKSDHVLQIYIHNVNGIQLDHDSGDINIITTEMHRINADIIALIETNIDNTNHKIKDIIHKTLRKYN